MSIVNASLSNLRKKKYDFLIYKITACGHFSSFHQIKHNNDFSKQILSNCHFFSQNGCFSHLWSLYEKKNISFY